MNSQTATITASITSSTKDASLDSSVTFKLSIQVIGIKKRCRKSERHFFQLGHIPYNDGNFDQSAISDKVQAFLNTNMKSIHSLTRVSLNHVTTIIDNGGYTIVQWKPFSKLNKSFDLNIVL
jgi:hypothetical protein